MRPAKQIGKNKKANLNLLPGESGADSSLWVYYNDEQSTFTSRWKLTWRERLMVLFHGSVWLSVMSGGHPPVRLDPVEPADLLGGDNDA